jgi:hypothetical protein
MRDLILLSLIFMENESEVVAVKIMMISWYVIVKRGVN